MWRITLFLLFASVACAGESWQDGRVVSFSSNVQGGPAVAMPIMGGGVVAGRLYATRVDIEIESGGSRYYCVEFRRGRQRLPVLAGNANLQIQVHKGDLTFLDQVGYKHKARIQSITQ